ncbi:hypothetical protein D9757_009892 [Collybiopsis confluens]|uniref:Uncharacterized protein n=1 Tax=Collybiopsis confluens TaxID=2823264 RepID=A0A8H5LUY8_9AGAR|nr:hypothetical protein D9757_009892 [Collybiopsis confluens]
MRLPSCMSFVLLSLASGSLAAPATRSPGHIPVHARWIKPGDEGTTTTATTGEAITKNSAELLIKNAVEANAGKMGLEAGAWSWSGFLPSSSNIIQYPGLQIYEGKHVVAAYILNPPKGHFPTDPYSPVLDLKTVVIIVDPWDGKAVHLSTEGNSLL